MGHTDAKPCGSLCFPVTPHFMKHGPSLEPWLVPGLADSPATRGHRQLKTPGGAQQSPQQPGLRDSGCTWSLVFGRRTGQRQGKVGCPETVGGLRPADPRESECSSTHGPETLSCLSILVESPPSTGATVSLGKLLWGQSAAAVWHGLSMGSVDWARLTFPNTATRVWSMYCSCSIVLQDQGREVRFRAVPVPST